MNTDLHIENIPLEMLDHLHHLAAQDNCSISTIAISLLQYGMEQKNNTSKPKETKDILKAIEESSLRRKQLSPDIEWLDSTELIREDRKR